MKRNEDKKETRSWRKIRIHKKISGTGKKPRLSIFKSNKYIYIQAIDDIGGKTVMAVNSHNSELLSEVKTSGKTVKMAKLLGEKIARLLKEKGIEEIVFDRSGYRYQGRIKAVADGAREAGLKF